MTTATQQKQARITYPLLVQEVEKLEALEKQLSAAADEAAKANRVGFHRAYLQLMRSAAAITKRERNRMKREGLAERNRRQQQMQEKARLDPASQQAPQGTGSPTQGNGSTS